MGADYKIPPPVRNGLIYRTLITLSLAIAPVMAHGQTATFLPADVLTEAVDPTKVDYLKRHVVASGAVRGPLRLVLPEDIYHARLILLGESHGSAAPQAIDLRLLTRLNAEVGLTDYVAEVDPVQAALLNRYIETGDEGPLDRVFDFWTESAQWGNQLFKDKIRKIRALNQTLPPARRIRFWGLDAVQDWPLLVEWLTDAGASPDGAALAAAATERDKAALALTWLDAASRADPVTLAALKAGLTQRMSGGNRESVVFTGYQHLVVSGALGDRPAYGLWGVFHVLQGAVNGNAPFAARVRQSGLPAAGSVVSIALVLLDSAVVLPTPTPDGVKMLRATTLNIDGPLVKVDGSADLRAATRSDTITLFDLAAPGSPYTTSPDFVSVATTLGQNFIPDDPEAPASAYLRLIGVVRGSDWAPPLRPR
jgi:hypothetical protein